jgi:hypothetical protein
MYNKIFLKLKKTLKTISSGQIYKKKQKKTKITQKTQKLPKTPKNPKNQKTKTTKHWAGLKKNRVFSNPASRRPCPTPSTCMTSVT